MLASLRLENLKSQEVCQVESNLDSFDPRYFCAKFRCHVRLKRSGAWWYEGNSNQMLALRCAKYNGTLGQVFVRYQQRQRSA
jgi:hypothetical protein